MIDISYIRSLFKYDPASGILFWDVKRPKVVLGAEAGSTSSTGYKRVTVDGRSYKVHRIIWAIQTGEWPSSDIDHIDGVRDNNKWSNLRLASKSQNGMNRKRTNSNTSGVKGVYWHSRASKWAAQVKLNRKVYYIGLFDSIDVAKEHVEKKRAELHCEFSRQE